jgi:predicted permease
MRTQNILSVSLTLPRGRYRTDREQLDLFARIQGRFEALPAVDGVTTTIFSPLIGALPIGMSLEPGEDAPEADPLAYLFPVGTEYFAVMDVPIRSGRPFGAGDDESGERVAIVSEMAAGLYWPGGGPVGQHIHKDGERYRVVGVAGDTRQNGLLGRTVPIVYLPFRQYPFLAQTLIVRTRGEPALVAGAVRDIVREEDEEIVMNRMSALSDVVWQALAEPRFYTVLVGTFGALGLLLAAAGLFAVVMVGVRRRRFEFGVRAAMGARPRDNLAIVLRQGLVTGGIGVLIGAAAGDPLTRILESVLYGVEPMDPYSTAAAAGLMLLAALAATLSPAIQAARVDPVDAIRAE